MTDVKTEDNHDNTGSDLLSAPDMIVKQLDHLDTMLHELAQTVSLQGTQLGEIHAFIQEHRPALAKALSLLDPGKGVRSFLTGGGKGRTRG